MNDSNTSPKHNILHFTGEQSAIIHSNGNLAINAVAGSGKTTTIIEYAASRPASSKILYLAFNKSVKMEAVRKFAERGLTNVTVETAHSLAYRYIMKENNYKIKSQGFKTHEIAELLGLKGNGEKHAEYIIANHINKFITFFCNSDKLKVQDLDYAKTISDPKAKNFVRSFYKHIENGTRQLLAKMDKGEIEITHDFYLKKFQLSAPVLSYDHILFDEGQDASAAMLDVFLKQKATKIMVGDAHQQIYGWRHAVNSLAQTNFNRLTLSTSFRFPQDIADLATAVLSWKKLFSDFQPVEIIGMGNNSKAHRSPPENVVPDGQTGTVITGTIATLARSNLGLLLNAINYITDKPNVKHIYFEGNIHSYTYADDGASLYDVLSLYNDNRDRIRDKLIQSMNSMDDLEEYIKSTEDAQLGMMVEIVNEYGNEIPGIIKKLKSLHAGDDERNKAEMVFSTVHKAKGMEYDSVHLVNDFITEQKIERTINESKDQKESFDEKKMNEEINLLYVAITRAKNKLHIPDALLPKNFPSSQHIQVTRPKQEESGNKYQEFLKDQKSGKTSRFYPKTSYQATRRSYSLAKSVGTANASYGPWTSELDRELIASYEKGKSIGELASDFGRTKGAIIYRLKKLKYYPE